VDIEGMRKRFFRSLRNSVECECAYSIAFFDSAAMFFLSIRID
jgi:hypothetical protein